MNILNHFVLLEQNRDLDTAIQVQYDLGLVLLSVLLAIFSSYIAFLVSRRIRSSEQHIYNLLWLWAGALALGSGIWAMHFIGMLAYILPVSINYDVTTTIISVIPAILSSLIVLKTSQDKDITAQSIFWRSVLMGSGIGLMHYIGMAAMLMNGVMRYDPWLFIFSILIAIVLAGVSLRFKLQADKYVTGGVIFSVKLLIPAVIMGCAISAMHYISMAAMYVFPDSANHLVTSAWSSDDLAKVISIITLLLGVLLIVAIEVSNRLDLYRKIKNSEQDLAITLNSIGDAVIATDASGLVTRMNPAAERLTGWSLKESQGKHLKSIFSIINTSTREPIKNPADKVISSGETVSLSKHITLIAKDGSEHQIADSAAPMRDGDGSIKGIVLVFNDVTEQYQLRKAGKESEERFRQLAENINEVFWLGSPAWDEIFYVSPAYEKIWGLNSEDLYQNPRLWIETVHPDDRDQVMDDIPKDINSIGEYVDFREYRIQRSDGQILWIKARAYPIYNHEGQVIRIAGIAEDITERKQGELIMKNIAIGVSAQLGEAFFESLAIHLAKIFDVEYVFIGLLDKHKENSITTIALCVDGEIVDDLSYDLEGTPCRHVVGGTGDSIQSYSSAIQQSFPDDHMLVDMGVESYVGVPLVDATGKCIGLLVVMGKKPMENIKQVENILQIFAVRTVAEMERLKTEETLAKSFKEWVYAMDSFEDAIYLIDLDDKLIRANKTFYQMTGLTPELAIGRDITTIIHPEGEEIPCPVCKARKEQRDEVIIMEADHPDNPAGRPIQITVQIIRDNEGSALSVLMAIRDLSNVRADEEESVKLQHQLHQSQKMDALGKLTGGIAHDYNNMLGVIMGYSDLLQGALDDQPKLAKYAHEIYHASERGARLTQKLLAFSRQKVSEAECINLNSLLLNEQHMLEKTLTVRIKLVLDLAEDLWAVWLDDSEMEDAILNMSINAMHAIEANGQLTVRTSNEQVNHLDAQALGLAAGDYVLLSMTDTGCGMGEATKEKIFEPFFSTKGEQGTGLGLSQVYGFVYRSGGAIKVYSEPGHGTRFALYFPRYNESEHKEQSVEENNIVDIKGTETILVVDDEPGLLSLNCEILAQHGFNVIPAESAKKALDILEHETVDLLITDIIMPEMDGYQLAAIVKEKYPDIKIQLASGFTDDRDMGMVDEDLQQNLLLKPFNSQALLQRIQILLLEKTHQQK